MPDTKLRARKATDRLRQDHEELRRLFRQFDHLGEDDRASKAELLGRIRQRLLEHTELEEATFYPAMDTIELAQDLVTDAHEEHEIMKLLLHQLSEMTPDDGYFGSRMNALIRNVERHMDEEEQALFPLFSRLDPEEQQRIADELRDRAESPDED